MHHLIEYSTCIKQIGMFEIFVNDAAKNYSPKVIAKYCYGLAVAFSSFYEHAKVLKAHQNWLMPDYV